MAIAIMAIMAIADKQRNDTRVKPLLVTYNNSSAKAPYKTSSKRFNAMTNPPRKTLPLFRSEAINTILVHIRFSSSNNINNSTSSSNNNNNNSSIINSTR